MLSGAGQSATSGRRKITIVGLSVVGVVLLCVPVTMASARLVWNVTPSAPPGLYRIEESNWRVGDRVAVQPSTVLAEDLHLRGVLPRGKALIKRVVAAQGDKVCREGTDITVNGSLAAVAKRQSSSGVLLPAWVSCRILDDGDVFLLGDTTDSYDGRYFGVTRRNEIIGPVQLIISF